MISRPGSLNHVAVSVTDMPLARRILRDCFGFTERMDRRVDGRELSVSMMAGNPVDIELLCFASGDRRPGRPTLVPHLAFDVADLGAAIATIAAHGGRLQNETPTRVGDTDNVWTTPESTAGMVIQLVARDATHER